MARSIKESTDKVVRRTTMILNDNDRLYLENLVKEGKELGFKSFLSKMFNYHRDLGMCDWNGRGVYNKGISRIAMLSQPMLDILISSVPEQKLREIGKELGKSMQLSLKVDNEVDRPDNENLSEGIRHASIMGLGEMSCRGDTIIVRNPFITNVHIFVGFLEGLLGVPIEAKSLTPPFVMQILDNKKMIMEVA